MSTTSRMHKREAPEHLCFAVITISTSRYDDSQMGKLTADESGNLVAEALKGHGHSVVLRRLVPDDKDIIDKTIREMLRSANVDAVITSGGTGINPSDVTIETLEPLFEKELPGFGEIFRRLSFDEIGSSALMTRAIAGVAEGKAIFCLPGSPQAVKMCVERLILPETGHIILHARGR